MKRYAKILIGALVAIIAIESHEISANNAHERAFLYVIKKADSQELKALAFAIAIAGYRRALEIMKSELNHVGSLRLQNTIDALRPLGAKYAFNTRFQLAKTYALSTFSKLPYRFQSKLKALINGGTTELEAKKVLLNNELKELNKPYQYVVHALKKKGAGWPDELRKLNYKTLLAGWSSFVWQAQSA